MAGETSVSCCNLRLRLVDFCDRLWRMPVLLRLILPVAVTLKRFFAELCVLTFGILVLKFSYRHPHRTQRFCALHAFFVIPSIFPFVIPSIPFCVIPSDSEESSVDASFRYASFSMTD